MSEENENKKMNKEEFFKTYQDIKDGKIKIEDLPLYEILRMNKIAEAELGSKAKLYENIEKELIEQEIEEHSSKKYTDKKD